MTAANVKAGQSPPEGFSLDKAAESGTFAGVTDGRGRKQRTSTPHFSVFSFPEMPSNRARMSEPLHAEVQGPILTGFGKRPLLQPAHQVLQLTGMRARTWGKRKSKFSEMFDNIVGSTYSFA